jgi:hypothetical protein
MLPLPARAQGPSAAHMPPADLEKVVGRWIDTREAIAREQREWQDGKAALLREIEILDAERAALTNELASFHESATAEEKERAETLREKEELDRALKKLVPLIEAAESKALRLLPVLPPMLAASLKAAVGDMDKPAGLTPPERLRNLLTFHAQLGAFQSSFHAGGAMIETEGRRRQCDVLYLGMARAFAVSGDNSWAAVGTPGAGGWTWIPRPDLAAPVRQAIDIHRRERPAALVSLPLGIASAEDPPPAGAAQPEEGSVKP